MKYALFENGNKSRYVVTVLETVEEVDKHGSFGAKWALSNHGESILPIRVNSRGGWCLFHMDDESLIRVSEDEINLTLTDIYPLNQENFSYGWMSPEGDTYTCDDAEHLAAAYAIWKEYYAKGNLNADTNIPDERLLHLGWVKVNSRKEAYVSKGKLSDKQKEKAEQLGLKKIREVDY